MFIPFHVDSQLQIGDYVLTDLLRDFFPLILFSKYLWHAFDSPKTLRSLWNLEHDDIKIGKHFGTLLECVSWPWKEKYTNSYLGFVPCSGYLAPEYALGGQLTMKADVYSFGVLVLEIISGKTSSQANFGGSQKFLLEWVC